MNGGAGWYVGALMVVIGILLFIKAERNAGARQEGLRRVAEIWRKLEELRGPDGTDRANVAQHSSELRQDIAEAQRLLGVTDEEMKRRERRSKKGFFTLSLRDTLPDIFPTLMRRDRDPKE